jgi:hypothetical protein
MLYHIHDVTRGETFVTEDADNAQRFFASRTKLHPSHLLHLWSVTDQGEARIIRRHGP